MAASRLLVAVSARALASTGDTLTLPQQSDAGGGGVRPLRRVSARPPRSGIVTAVLDRLTFSPAGLAR